MVKKIALFICLAAMLSFVFVACENMGSDDGSDDDFSVDDFLSSERGISVGAPGGAVANLATYLVDGIDVATDLPYTVDFTISNNGGIEIGFWGINDISDMDSVSYHDGKATISYTDDSSSFSILPDESYPFSVTLDDTAVAASTYQIEIGISNKNDVTPNPYTFKVRFVTN